MSGINGLDEELQVTETENIMDSQVKEKKRAAFHFWTVRGKEYKMKLTTSMITKLENKYRRNIVSIVMDDDVPPLGVMLTVAQAALAPWEHKVSYNDVERLYDSYLEEGGNMVEFFREVIVPTMAVSGFFTDKQVESILQSMEEEKILA